MARARKICLTNGCGKVATSGNRCADCRRRFEAARGSRHVRGYGSSHEAVRAELMKLIKKEWARGNQPLCRRCGRPMLPGQPLDAGHPDRDLARDGGVADALEHASCNRGRR